MRDTSRLCKNVCSTLGYLPRIWISQHLTILSLVQSGNKACTRDVNCIILVCRCAHKMLAENHAGCETGYTMWW